MDEGALALFLRRIPTAEALAMAQRTYQMYSTQLRDAFDMRDVGAVKQDGPEGTSGVRPYCNLHYTRCGRTRLCFRVQGNVGFLPRV